MGAHGEGGELGVGHDRHPHVASVGLRSELALVEGGDTPGVVGDDDVGVRLLLHHFDLPHRGEGPAEIPRDEDVAEPEPAAVEEGGVVGHFGPHRFDQSGDGGGPLPAVDVGVVDGVLFHQLVVVAGRMDAGDDP